MGAELRQVALTDEELHDCQVAFTKVDTNSSGAIDIQELRKVLKELGLTPSEDELFAMISSVDADHNGEICFGEFLKVVNNGKFFSGGLNPDIDDDDEVDMLEAFVSLGGEGDKSGKIDTAKLKDIINLFDLDIDTDTLLVSDDNTIDFEEFKKFFGGTGLGNYV